MNSRRGTILLLLATLLLVTGPAFASSDALPEVENLRFLDDDVFEWDQAPLADVYNVYRGDLGALADYGNCFKPEEPTNQSSDTDLPPPGQGFFYLVTAARGTQEGTLGFDSDGVERQSVDPCLIAPAPLLDLIDPNGPASPDGVVYGVAAPRNPAVGNDLNGLAGGGVHLHTGEFFVRHTDLEIPGRGIHWRHVRSYRGQINHDGQQGVNWTFNYDRRITDSGASSLLHLDGTGREDEFVLGAGGLYEPVTAGLYQKIRENPDGTFTLRERDGTLYHYHPLIFSPLGGRLSAIEDRLGNRLELLYSDEGLLCTVVDTLGRAIHYFWNADARLHSVVDPEGREVRYEYDSEGNLAFVTSPAVTGTSTGNDFPGGKTTAYTYDSGTGDPRLDHNLLTVTAPGDVDPFLENSFNAEDELVAQQYGGLNSSGVPAGGTYEFSIQKPGSGFRETRIVDREGIEHFVVTDLEGHATQERVKTTGIRPGDPPEFVTDHAYNAQGERTETTHALGNAVVYVYDDTNPDVFQRGNLLSVERIPDASRGDGFGGTLAGVAVQYEYEPLYTQQRVIVDPAGRASEYVYDYQEGDPSLNGANALAADWNIDLGVVPLSVGEVNGDGRDDQNFGNPVLLDQPDATLFPGGRQEAIEGGPTQPIETRYRYNDVGQLVVEIDPEGNVQVHDYHPETDPDGDGVPTPPPPDGRTLDPATGGYLGSTTLDAAPGPYLDPAEIDRRDNATNPPAAEILNTYSYDPVGNLIASSDGRGVETRYEVNQLGQIVSVRRGVCPTPPCPDPDIPDTGLRAEQIYNERDEIVTRRVEDFGDLSGTGGFIETEFVYDILGNAVSVSREEGGGVSRITEFRHDAQERRVSTRLPEGNVHHLHYDERGLLYRVVRGDDDLDPSTLPPGTSEQTYDYDPNGNLTEFVDGRGTPWGFVYDGLDRRVRADLAKPDPPPVPPDSFFDVLYNPDETVREIRIQDGTGIVLYDARYEYDELGRVTELRQAILDASGAPIPESFDGDEWTSVVTEYDRNSRRSRVWMDDREIHDFDHDGAGRLLRKVDAVGNETRFTYDASNNVVETETVELALTGTETFKTVSTYDRLNRMTSTTNDLSHTTEFRYDSRDNVVELIDAIGNTVRYSYDGLDRRIEITRDLRDGGGPPGPVVDQIVYGFEYDGNGRLVRTVDPEGNETTYTYDGLDRKITDTFDDGTAIQYGYDGNDNVTQVVDANGSTITIAYDATDRLVERTVTPAPGVRQNAQTYEYDPLNRLVRATDDNDQGPSESTEVSFEYDSLNRIRSETSRYGSRPSRTFTHSYDGDGNRVDSSHPAGTVLSYSYDPLNRLEVVQEATGTGYRADYSYLGPERIAERVHGNDTRKSYLDAPGSTDVGYDGIKRVIRISHYDPTSTVQAQIDYGYDPVGNIIREERVHAGSTDTYGYDSAYRLVEYERDVGGPVAPTQIQYTLDRVGNWLERVIDGQPFGYTPNNLNEYDEPQSGGTRTDDGIPDDFDDDLGTGTPDGINLGHDENGDLITEDDRSYEYDALHRLVFVSDSGGPVAHYVYDALNRRIAKENLLPGGEDSRFVWEGDRIVEELDLTTGFLRRRYLHGAGGEPVAVRVEGTGTLYYLHDDVRGSTVMVTDPGAAIVERITYDAHGEPRFEDAANNPTGATESVIGNPFLYQGQYWDTETELYEDRGALFAPRFGRHLQRFLPGQLLGPQGWALNVPWLWPCPVNWIGMNPFWWNKGWFWHPGAWHCGWWAWKPGWWWGGPWGWWRWRPWVWIHGAFDGWWTIKPWVFWWHHPFRWWGWRAWWPWAGWWGFWPFWGWFGWSHWLPVWGWLGWHGWWPWWGWAGWCGWWPSFGWWGWCGWWPWWNLWWSWHPWWWWGWWTWSPFWWHGFWGWAGLGFWRWCWGWLHWWPWGWWNWSGWLWWWGWYGWNPWWWWGWWAWWPFGWVLRGFHWWWGPLGWGPWFGGWWPWWWWGWWAWLVPWGCWLWRIGWWGFWWWPWWAAWWGGWWSWPWWGFYLWWGWWWPWWGWF